MRRILRDIAAVAVLLLFGVVESAAVGAAGIYQWSVGLRGYVSAETGKEPQAFLWLPEGVDTVRALVVAQQNMTEEMLFKDAVFRERMARAGVGLVWIAPWLSQTWDPASGAQQVFEEMLAGLAGQSGHTEIATRTAIIPFGHSAQATFPWNFAAWNNARTLCVISFHGDAPRTNLCGFGTANVEWGRTRNIDGIPGLMIEGEYEWWEARVRPALAFRLMYPESCVSFLCDTGRGHFDLAEETAMYIARFIEKSLEARQPRFGEALLRVDPRRGWLCERWRGAQTDGVESDGASTVEQGRMTPVNTEKCMGSSTLTRGTKGRMERASAAPWAEYRGDHHDAFWYFDREMALMTEARYARDGAKRRRAVGFEWRDARVTLPEGKSGTLRLRLTEADVSKGVVWVKAVCEESDGASTVEQGQQTKRGARRRAANSTLTRGARGLLNTGGAHIEVVCGPLEKTGERDRRGYEALRVVPYECGTDNPKRSFTAWIVAIADGDSTYKDAVEPMEVLLPRP